MPNGTLEIQQPDGGTRGDPQQLVEMDVPPSNGSVEPQIDGLLPPTARDVLLEFCGDCHGARAIVAGNVQGGIDYIEDIDVLVANGLVTPLDSSRSLLVQVMRAQTMPPPGVQPRPDEYDISTVEDFIDNPLFWQVPGIPCTPAYESSPDFSGFSLGEVSIETSGECGDGGLVCLVNQFQGRITCPKGQSGTPGDFPCSTPRGVPVEVSVAPQLESRPANRAVVCSCRCDGPDPGASYCTCPGEMRCEALTSEPIADPTLVGSYCVY